jgi:hypothetical protein
MGGINMWHGSNRFDPRYGDADTSGSRYTVKGIQGNSRDTKGNSGDKGIPGTQY